MVLKALGNILPQTASEHVLQLDIWLRLKKILLFPVTWLKKLGSVGWQFKKKVILFLIV